MNNAKIEYTDGLLTKLELDGVSLTKAVLTGLKLEHPHGGRPKLTLEANSDQPERSKHEISVPAWIFKEGTSCIGTTSQKLESTHEGLVACGDTIEQKTLSALLERCLCNVAPERMRETGTSLADTVKRSFQALKKPLPGGMGG